MKTGLFISLSALILLGIGVGVNLQKESSTPDSAVEHFSDDLILLELFTSQGCSSCPPAESVLAKIANDDRYSAVVIPLAYHVDYWDYLGWRDPFSSTQWTERQANYREAFGEATLYTPQIVIQGEYEAVGSDENKIKKRINQLVSTPKENLAKISIKDVVLKDNHVLLNVMASRQDSSFKGMVMVMAAVFENVSATDVQAGENAGRTLRNDYVVRSLDAKPLMLAKEGQKHIQVSLLLEEDWNHENLGIVSWIQDAKSMEIYHVDVTKGLVGSAGG